jgi:hypothetical protein
MSNYKEIWSTPIAEYFVEPKIHNDFVEWLKLPRGVGPEGNQFNLLENIDTEFTQWVIASCKDYISKFHTDPGIPYIKRSWITTQKYGEPNQTHSHGGTDIVGVYYLESHKGHPGLNVYDPRPPHIFNEVKFFNDSGIMIADCARSINIEAITGKLFFMPGYLLHGVDINITDVPRSSVAFNINIHRG